MQSNPILKDLGRRKTNERWSMPHRHFIHRLYYVNDGKAEILFGGKNYTLTKGNVYLMSPTESYERLSAEGFDYTYFSFYNSPTMYSNTLLEIPGDLGNLNALFQFINPLIESTPRDKQTELRLLKVCLATLEQHISLPFIAESHIIRALEIINKGVDTNITVANLSERLHLSESYFVHLFTNTMGCSPMKYIRSLRLSEAQNMLQKGISVAEVAEYCGYASSTALWKAIRKEFGCSPGALKNKKS